MFTLNVCMSPYDYEILPFCLIPIYLMKFNKSPKLLVTGFIIRLKFKYSGLLFILHSNAQVFVIKNHEEE